MEDLTFSTQSLKIKAKLKFWKPVKLNLIGKIKGQVRSNNKLSSNERA